MNSKNKNQTMAKTKFQIKNRYTGEIIVEMEAETLKEVVEKNADLREANLRGADLQGADLRGADLWGIKIKITQKEDLIKNLGIVVENKK